MEAKDTVIQAKDEPAYFGSVSALLTKQADVTWNYAFKAGRDKGYENGYTDGYNRAKQEDIESLLRWVIDHYDGGLVFDNWQAFLVKEGIEVKHGKHGCESKDRES